MKLNLLKLLFEKYGVTEADFLSAELEVVPAFKASDVGLDPELVGRLRSGRPGSAPTSEMEAVFDCGVPDTTVMCIFADKEEIGSVGCTGMKSAFLRHFIEDLAAPYGIAGRTVLQHSQCLSADVSAAFDPTFPEVCERKNNAFVNYGVSICKYTGARGKSGSSDASAEFMGWVRKILDEGNVLWQTSELGKVDQGGGGTVAAYIAELDVDTIDVGVPGALHARSLRDDCKDRRVFRLPCVCGFLQGIRNQKNSPVWNTYGGNFCILRRVRIEGACRYYR